MPLNQNSIRLIKGGTILGDNKANTSTAIPTTEGYTTFGSSSDLWGLSFVPTDINASNFGVALSVYSTNSGVVSQYLTATNFSFSIPTTATIDGITVEPKWMADAAGNPRVCSVNYVRITINYSDPATGSATGDSTASVVGAFIANSVGAAAGDSTGISIGSSLFNTVGICDGDSAAGAILSIAFDYAATGGFILSGTYFIPDLTFSVVASGSFVLSGSPEIVASNLSFPEIKQTITNSSRKENKIIQQRTLTYTGWGYSKKAVVPAVTQRNLGKSW